MFLGTTTRISCGLMINATHVSGSLARKCFGRYQLKRRGDEGKGWEEDCGGDRGEREERNPVGRAKGENEEKLVG